MNSLYHPKVKARNKLPKAVLRSQDYQHVSSEIGWEMVERSLNVQQAEQFREASICQQMCIYLSNINDIS